MDVCSASFSNQALPIGISTAPFLAFFWDDLLDFGSGEYLEYATFGSAGGRVFNLYFRNRLFSSVCGSAAMVAAITIHEGSNLVSVNYAPTTGCAELRGGSATLGLQTAGGGGGASMLLGYNSPVIDDNNPSSQFMSFHP